MEDTMIDIIGENEAKSSYDVPMPVNFVTVGIIEHDSVRVYIKQDVYKRIEKFAKEEMSKEVGSILIGDYVEENNKTSVIISDYIEAKYTDASASTLTFTHETWDYVYKEKDKKYPDKKIVGWQHTHPGYGIFLSNYDIFIQDNFFNLPWQIAYVVDPIADTRGFFEWKNNKTSKMTGFYVYDDVGRKICISEKNKPSKKSISVSTVILSFLLFVSILLTISFGIEKDNYAKRLEESLRIKAETEIESPDTESEKNISLSENTEVFRIYEVKANDGLEAICKSFDLDYTENISKIMKINSISDPDLIITGQKLYLPINK
ncbi:MAG: LysM peptidoglycan-binding domain-containing protein [Clostridia bacterium]|nr:LysM peptidoglycan-binding domain-containing protein [Clostridia bacterium]